MRHFLVLASLCCSAWCSAFSADTITPAITTTIVQTGNASAYADANYSFSGNDFLASIIGSSTTYPGPPNDGGRAQADITFEAQLLAPGSGQALLNYQAGGSADGSLGGFSAGYQIDSVSANCLFSCTQASSTTIDLGVPFYVMLRGTSFAFSGPNFEDAAYNVAIQLNVTQNGMFVPLEIVGLPTPEPGTISLVFSALGVVALGFGLRRKRQRISPATASKFKRRSLEKPLSEAARASQYQWCP